MGSLLVRAIIFIHQCNIVGMRFYDVKFVNDYEGRNKYNPAGLARSWVVPMLVSTAASQLMAIC